MSEPRIYGVSFGNGNDGVSQMFADYYVRVDDPWTLARAAMLGQFKPGEGHAWANRHIEIEGDAEHTIYATIDAPPCRETEDGEYPELPEGMEYEDAEDGRNWSEYHGQWMICEVFPEESPREGRPVYDSIEDALPADVLALARK